MLRLRPLCVDVRTARYRTSAPAQEAAIAEAARVPRQRSERPGRLFVVATPIGNIGDLSPRARSTLLGSALIAAEDTRVLRKLLARAAASDELEEEVEGGSAGGGELHAPSAAAARRVIACHEHNHASRLPEILAALALGGDVALVSDAGTPLISDPGAQLVAAVLRAGFAVSPIPGPCAAAAALSVSGAAAPDGFLVLGFLPRQGPPRARQLALIASERSRPLVLYEAPHRLGRTLADLVALEAAGGGGPGGLRRVTLCRELSKGAHEQVLAFDSIAALRASVGERDAEAAGGAQVAAAGRAPPIIPCLGEFTLVIHAAESRERGGGAEAAAACGESRAFRPSACARAEAPGGASEPGDASAALVGGSGGAAAAAAPPPRGGTLHNGTADGDGDAAESSPLEEGLRQFDALRDAVPALRASDAVRRVAALVGCSRSALYAAVLLRDARATE